MDAETRIARFVTAQQNEIIRTLNDLIAIPTENPPGRCYRELTDYISALLANWGVERETFTIPHERHRRFSIIGSYGRGEPSLHFHGHYDVVIAQSQEQFRPAQRKGRIYGRGSSDMKGGIVAMLFALRAIQECGITISKRLTLTLVPGSRKCPSLPLQFGRAGKWGHGCLSSIFGLSYQPASSPSNASVGAAHAPP